MKTAVNRGSQAARKARPVDTIADARKAAKGTAV